MAASRFKRLDFCVSAAREHPRTRRDRNRCRLASLRSVVTVFAAKPDVLVPTPCFGRPWDAVLCVDDRHVGEGIGRSAGFQGEQTRSGLAFDWIVRFCGGGQRYRERKRDRTRVRARGCPARQPRGGCVPKEAVQEIANTAGAASNRNVAADSYSVVPTV